MKELLESGWLTYYAAIVSSLLSFVVLMLLSYFSSEKKGLERLSFSTNLAALFVYLSATFGGSIALFFGYVYKEYSELNVSRWLENNSSFIAMLLGVLAAYMASDFYKLFAENSVLNTMYKKLLHRVYGQPGTIGQHHSKPIPGRDSDESK